MERYTKEDLRWQMASYSGLDVYGPSRRVFRYTVPRGRIVLHNFGNQYNDQWRIGSCDDRGNVRTWSVSHHTSIDGVLAALNGDSCEP
jgi:hypothetical protein